MSLLPDGFIERARAMALGRNDHEAWVSKRKQLEQSLEELNRLRSDTGNPVALIVLTREIRAIEQWLKGEV